MDTRFTFGLFHIHKLSIGKDICWGFDFFTFNLKSLLALWVDGDGVGVDLLFTHWQVWDRPQVPEMRYQHDLHCNADRRKPKHSEHSGCSCKK